MSNPISIHFHSLTPVRLKDRKALKEFLKNLLEEEKREIESINIIFCDDQYLLKINQDFLKHDTYTDIITFQLSKKQLPLLADIYISVERVKANADTYASSFRRELHRVIFHGFLHLAGYGDKSKIDAQQIRNKEDFYLTKYFVPREIDTSD